MISTDGMVEIVDTDQSLKTPRRALVHKMIAINQSAYVLTWWPDSESYIHPDFPEILVIID